jgi:hypothetical protein
MNNESSKELREQIQEIAHFESDYQLDRLLDLFNQAITKARMDEHYWWDGLYDNDEVDKEELKTHRAIRIKNLKSTNKEEVGGE